MDEVRTKYDSLIRSRNKHELSMMRDEIDMALICIEPETDSRVEGKRN